MRFLARNKSQKFGFTLTEVIVVVFLLGVVLSMVIPTVNWGIVRSKFVSCQYRLEMIARAKTGFSIDHQGQTTISTSDDWDVFNMYLPEPFPFHCPRVSDSDSSGDYDATSLRMLYSVTVCPFCQSHPMN